MSPEKYVLLVEEEQSNDVMTKEEAPEIITIIDKTEEAPTTELDIAIRKANNDDLEQSVVFIESNQPEVITIIDDTDVITIADEADDVITIVDEDVMSITEVNPKCTILAEEPIEITNENNCSTTEGLQTMNNVKTTNDLINKKDSESKDHSKSSNTEAGVLDAKSVKLKTSNNELDEIDLTQCDKSPCKELHKVIEEKKVYNKVPKFGVPQAKTLAKAEKTFSSPKYMAKLTSAMESEGMAQEKELANKFEERVSDYMNLDLLVCSVIHRGTYSIIFNCIDSEGLHVAAKMIK